MCLIHSSFFCVVHRRYLGASGLMSQKRRTLSFISVASVKETKQKICFSPSWRFTTAWVRAYARVTRTCALSHFYKVLGTLGWCGFLYRFRNVILRCRFVTTLFYSPCVLVTVEIQFTHIFYKTPEMK